MTTFQYTGIDLSGRAVTGTLAAEDAGALEQRLRQSDIWLVEAAPATPPDRSPVAQRRARQAARSGRPAPRRQLISFCTMMDFLARVGIPMVQALEIVAEDCEHPGFRQTLEAVRAEVQGGKKLYESLETFPRQFSPHFISLVRVGEASGSLPESMAELRRHLEWQDQIAADIRQATLYPLIVSVLVGAFVLLLFSFVVPRFAQLLAVTKVPLPLPTRFVFGASDFVKSTFWIWLLLAVIVPSGVSLGRRWSVRFSCAYDRFRFSLPVFGPLNHMLAMSQVAQSLALLYRSGVTLLSSLRLCEGLANSPLIAGSLRDIHDRIEGGATLSEGMRRHSVFPPLFIRMVVLGERTGSLDRALENVVAYYGLIVPRRLKKVFGILEPALILALVGIVGLVALAVLMPIFSLMQGIR